jgi:hypothetical protein
MDKLRERSENINLKRSGGILFPECTSGHCVHSMGEENSLNETVVGTESQSFHFLVKVMSGEGQDLKTPESFFCLDLQLPSISSHRRTSGWRNWPKA